MSLTVLSLMALAGLGVASGWLGALVGIGGGVVIVPALVLGFGVDFRVGVAASLVAVIATSTTAGSAYVGQGLVNMRLGMTLEVATTIGGVAGGLAATLLSPRILAGFFTVVMAATAFLMLRGARNPRRRKVETVHTDTGWEETGRLAGAYMDPARGGLVRYETRRLPIGSAVSLVAGAVSGMLGIGGGFLKVPAMNLGMDVPVKVAAATSNFMIGVTAAASVFIYFARGFIQPLLVAPLTLGVIAGSWAGTRTSARVHPSLLKRVLALVLILAAIQMGLRSIGVGLDG